MDVQTGLVYVAVVVVSALVIGFVSVFAMREKSYEEAIAEQRKLPDDLLLAKKDKVKEKKHKNKTGKKIREKREDKEEKEEKPEHVQFEENPQILPPEPPVQENGKGGKKKGKVEKVKPILVNKDEPVVVITEPSPSQPLSSQETNHFEIIQPKDDLELIRSHSRENLHQISQSDSVVSKTPKETPTKTKKNAKDKDQKKKDEHKEDKKETSSAIQQALKEAPKEVKEKSKESVKEKETKEVVKEIVAVQSVSKESKKVKKKTDILAQIGGERDGVTFSLLEPLVKKAELSRSEIQFLIDQLLNKQQDNPLEHAEWTESRADPVIKLKKQLADKEKALKDEQEASASVQSKIVELRAELNSERSRLTTSVRQLEEALSARVTEAQTLHTRMQHILESHAAEKQGFSRQIEQLQAKVSEDQAIIVKMQEDQGQSHGQMQQELLAQRKQLEMQFAQMRDNENALKAQLAQKCVEYQELQNVNISMSQELQATCESSTHEIEMLRQQLAVMQEQINYSEGQLQHFKDAGERLQDMHRQLEESRRLQSDMDHRMKSMHRHEQDLQKKVNWLQSELEAAKKEANEAANLKEKVSKLQSELTEAKSNATETSSVDGSAAPEASVLQTQLKVKEQELQKALADLDKVQIEYKKSQADVKKLDTELTEARSHLKSVKSELARVQDNYKLSQTDLHKCQEELREIQHVLAQTRAEFSKINSSVSGSKDAKSGEAELQILRLKEENDRLASQMRGLTDLQKEVMLLREKNESLSSQLAAAAQRPAVEGRENGIEEKSQKKSTQSLENANLLAQKDEHLNTLRTTLSQKEKELGHLGSQVESLRSEVNDQRNIAAKLKDDLEEQRSKNNVDAQKLKREEQEATKVWLQRIFPEIRISEKTHDQWVKVFEEQVTITLNKSKADLKSEEANLELEKTNKSLQAMVNNYKQIICDTEGMLNKLQNHIESEEKRWQAQLRQKESEVSSLKVEIHDLQNKTAFNDELQQKITELEAKLAEATSLRDRVESESQNLKPKNSHNRTQDMAALEQLQEEKGRLAHQLQSESSKLSSLESEVSKLRQLVETSESNLAQEKELVSQLQQEISLLKSEMDDGRSSPDQLSLNGPSTGDSPKSESKNSMAKGRKLT
ncbi:hypothetical protein QAD02_005291, partial [Eretmocerus hayati]